MMFRKVTRFYLFLAAYMLLGLFAFIGIAVLLWEIYVDLFFLIWVGIDRFTIEVIIKDPYLWVGLILSASTIYGIIRVRRYSRKMNPA